MLKFLVAVVAMVLAMPAMAADVLASVTVLKGTDIVYQQTNSFIGLTDDEAAKLYTSGMKQVDFASKHQDKGGPYTIRWKWNSMPAIETQGMKFGPVNATLRKGHQWLDEQLLAAEKAEKASKSKPWGK